VNALLFLSVILFLLSPLRGFAAERFFVGATGGVGRTSLSGDAPDEASYTSKTGFTIGVLAEYAVTPGIHVGLHPSYVRRGTGVAYDVGEEDPRDSFSVSLDYLSFPLLLRFLSEQRSWFVTGGVDIGFLLDASLKNLGTGTTTGVGSAFNEFDVMMIIGAGGVVDLRSVLLAVELRYGQSIPNAGANIGLESTFGLPPRFRSSGLQLNVAVLRPL
jgi:hypothetical protein